MVSEQALPQSRYFTLERLADGVYAAIIVPGAGAWGNAGVVNLGNATLIFDTFLIPSAAGTLRSIAERLNGTATGYVVNSHYHMDHIQGNQVFDDAQIIATERTREIMATRGAELIAQVKAHPEYPDTFDTLIAQEQDEAKKRDLARTQSEYRALNEEREGLELRLPDITFERRLTLHGSQRDVEVLSYGGGHTPSDAFLYLPAERIAFMGDLVSVRTHPSFFGDVDAWMDMLDRIGQLDIQTLVPGHGPVGTLADAAAVRHYLVEMKALVEARQRRREDEAGIDAEPIPAAYAEWDAPTTFAQNLRYLYRQSTSV